MQNKYTKDYTMKKLDHYHLSKIIIYPTVEAASDCYIKYDGIPI